MARAKNRKPTSSSDPVTKYAKDVGAGRIIAGPHVRDACKRHIRDKKHGKKRGLAWDQEACDRALEYFAKVLKLSGGQFEGKPFILEPWQAFIVGSLFGWKTRDGQPAKLEISKLPRRFRVCFIETGKGSGKSPVAAGVGMYMLTSDKEARAEIYAAATKKDQARVLFRDAVAMVEMAPDLAGRLKLTGGESEKNNIAYLATGSFFRPISTEDRGKGQSGPRPHCSLLDEIHEHPTNAMVEFLRAGVKFRIQPMTFMITNSGANRQSVCYEYHEYANKVAAGKFEDDAFFGYVCALDKGEDPFKSEACWIKANPNLGVTIEKSYLREQVTQARGMPSKENIVRRLNFCQWTDSIDSWISQENWEAVEADLDLTKYYGRRLILGLDLSSKRDLTALTLLFPDDDGGDGMDTFTEFWTPADTLADREAKDRAPYGAWRDAGYLTAVPGKAIDYAFVAQRLGELAADFELELLEYDRWRIDDLERELEKAGIPAYKKKAESDTGEGIALVECGQGFKDMAPAVDHTEDAILNRVIRIDRNPVLAWCASSAVLETDAAANRKFTKKHSTGRIDGIVSLAMAIKGASDLPKPSEAQIQVIIL